MPDAALTVVDQPRFDFSAGALCLDFTNTLADRPACRREKLGGFSDLVAWGRQSFTLGPAEADRLEGLAGRRPRDADRMLQRAKRFRETLYRMFAEIASGRAPNPRAVAAVNRELGLALPNLRLVPSDGRFRWAWNDSGDALDRLLWPVVRSAGDLLASDELRWVRECASDGCSWLFLDRSRSRRRRWCDMRTCGNREKARRHYRRKKASAV